MKKNKIDLSPLNATTKKKIEKLKKRIGELYKGVNKEITIPMNMKFSITSHWTDGMEGYVYVSKPCAEQKCIALTKKYTKEINKEIKEILNFSDSIAKKLKVDKEVFWNRVFLS